MYWATTKIVILIDTFYKINQQNDLNLRTSK